MQPPWLWPRAAYVHVPFCAHHCGYCDFAIAVGAEDRIDTYLDALAAELATLGEPQPVRTRFLGGGTPSHLSVRQLERLLRDLNHWLPPLPGVVAELARVQPGGASRLNSGEFSYDWPEYSIEANPDSLDADKVVVLAAHGITRVSLGAQSFHGHLLRALDRAHTAAEVPRAVERVRRRGLQVSLDLIFGVPGQTPAEWRADLTAALALEPDHVSTYGLTYEKGTPLWKRRQRGEVRPVGEEDEREMYAIAIDTLEGAGFQHYEISNFARPGRQCLHNHVYWANEAYFGFGMGAARYVRGRREVNTRDLGAYLRRALAGEPTAFQSEVLGPEERARETLAVQFRRSAGVDRDAYRLQTGFDLDVLAGPVVARHVELGLLADDGGRVCLTRAGKFVADSVIASLL